MCSRYALMHLTTRLWPPHAAHKQSQRTPLPQFAPGGPMREVAAFDTADGLYDCCWCEDNEHILVSASGDGSVKASLLVMLRPRRLRFSPFSFISVSLARCGTCQHRDTRTRCAVWKSTVTRCIASLGTACVETSSCQLPGMIPSSSGAHSHALMQPASAEM